MYKKLTLLNPGLHEDLRLITAESYHFASRQMVAPIVFPEMADIAREYPLIFLKNNPMPHALLGLEQNTSAYVSKDGRWLAQYIPQWIKAYPFSLIQNPNNPEQFGVAVDVESELINRDRGQPLFSMGKPTQTLTRYMDLLKEMQKSEAVTRQMVKVVRDAGLLVERPVRVKKIDQKDSQLKGLEFVDEKKLNQMPHADFNKLRDSGALPLIYSHLLSIANLRRGILKGQMSPATEEPDPGFSLGDDDMIKFQ